MSLATSHIHVKSGSVEKVGNSLKGYCLMHGATFAPHDTYSLTGVEQVLRCLIRPKKRREFTVSGPSDGWCVVREHVQWSEFADPAVARRLSEDCLEYAIWSNFDENYNIWAYQVYREGVLESEVFEPTAYFLGQDDHADLESWGSCHDEAEKFNDRWQLPQFLCSPPLIKRERKLQLPSTTFRVTLPGTA